MYRINLYPAGATRRMERNKAVGRGAVVTVLAIANAVFLGLFVVTAMNVSHRADQAEQMVRKQRETLTEAQRGNRAVPNQIRTIVERRNERLAWTPVLAEVSSLLPGNLIIDQIEASAGVGGGPRSGMTLNGHLRVGQNMDQVIEYTRRLSESPVYRRQFAEARLGSMESKEGVARFRITCPLIAHASADSTSEEVAG